MCVLARSAWQCRSYQQRLLCLAQPPLPAPISCCQLQQQPSVSAAMPCWDRIFQWFSGSVELYLQQGYKPFCSCGAPAPRKSLLWLSLRCLQSSPAVMLSFVHPE